MATGNFWERILVSVHPGNVRFPLNHKIPELSKPEQMTRKFLVKVSEKSENCASIKMRTSQPKNSNIPGEKSNETRIDHFTVVCLVTWPLDDSEARVDLVLIQTSLLLLCKTSCSDAN